jgi:hypothetical protein
MVDWSVGGEGGAVVFDQGGGLLLLLAVLVAVYLIFQAGFWIGRSVGLRRSGRATRADDRR